MMLYARETVGGRDLRPDERERSSLVANVDVPGETDVWCAPRQVIVRGWVTSENGPCSVVAHIGAFDVVPVALTEVRDDIDEFLGATVAPGRLRGFDQVLDLPDLDVVMLSLRFTDGIHVAISDEYRYSTAERPPIPIVGLPSQQPRRRRRRARARAEYQAVWDDVARDHGVAKVAVAGYEDEDVFAQMADETVGALQRTVGIKPDDEVLEIGAGVGRVGTALAPICKRWVAADVSANMLKHAQARLARFDNVETVVLSGWDLRPIPSESFDLVYCTVVFMHLDEWDRYAYVCEAMRVLRPGGRIYIDNYSLTTDLGWSFFLHHVEDLHPLDRPANISKSSTADELRTYLTRAGFSDVRVRTSGYFVWSWGRKPRPGQ